MRSFIPTYLCLYGGGGGGGKSVGVRPVSIRQWSVIRNHTSVYLPKMICSAGFCLGDVEWWSKFHFQDTSTS